MLIELRIRDYAVIDELSLSLESGLNVLSGETGAGKSIIVGALSLLVGDRASSQVVREGADRSVIEAVFDIGRSDRIQEKLVEGGFSFEEDLLILRREVAAEGRNRAWVNGSPATASTVGSLGEMLVDIHGQHDHQSLLRASRQREILDVYGRATGLAEEVTDRYRNTVALQKALQEKRTRIRELEARADFLRFQLQEIEAGDLSPGEEEALEGEARRLEHAQELASGARGLQESLYGEEGSVSDRVAELQSLLDRLARLDPSLSEASSTLGEAFHLLAEAGQRMGSYAAGIESDPGRLEEIRERQDLIFKLKRKYGPELEDVLATGDRVKAELEELAEAPGDLRQEEEELERSTSEFLAKAQELTDRRTKAADRLQRAVQAVLPELGLPKAEFDVQLSPLDEPGAAGAERIDFLTSLNPGFTAGPLRQIASGGELSRIMLALKAVLAEADSVPTLVFDEIDSGVGGEVALRVADKLKEVARHHQVFVITHLPQLASRAHHQLSVEKDDLEGLASTRVRELTGEDRIAEVARMLGGDPDSAASREHARELLRSA
jgi:DNA repair protein RecN (Recombination protein N)